jgi:hypothetical protein
MRFTFEGREYVLEFSRAYKQVKVVKQKKELTVRSEYPYTTATLYQVNEAAPHQRSFVTFATVGCAPFEQFSHAAGRLLALQDLSIKLRKLLKYSKEFNTALWQAYTNRGRLPVVIAEPVKEGELLEGSAD